MRTCATLNTQLFIKEKIYTGFSLIEILISLAIMSLIAGIIIPNYSQHMVHTKRLQAEISLTKIAAALEQYAAINNTYQHASLENLQVPKNNDYSFNITNTTDTQFSLSAEPLEQQAVKDTQCATLTLDSTGKKGSSGNKTTEECW